MRGYPALYDHGQQHLKACLPIDRVRHVRRHDDALPGGDEVRLAVDGEAASAVEHGDERVAVGGVRADLLVMLRARFCASVLLTICPCWYSTSSPRRSTCAFSMFFRPMIRSPLFLTVEILPAVWRSYTFVQSSRPGTCGRDAKLSACLRCMPIMVLPMSSPASCASVGMKSRISPLWNFSYATMSK